MPCHAAVVQDDVCVSPDDKVETVMLALEKAGRRVAAVVDGDGVFLGSFSLKVLLKNLLPVSVAMADGVQIDVKVSAAPGVSKRLSNIKPLPVSEIMDRKPVTVLPDTPVWEGVGLLVKHGSPLVVVDDDTQRYHGFVTYESLVDNLENAHSSDG